METQPLKNKKIIQDFMNAIWVKRDMELALNYVAKNVQYHGVRNEFHGKEHYKEMIKAYISAFDEVKITIEDMVAEKTKVFFRSTFTGIHKGAFEGILPTHKKISIKVFNEMEIEDGKIIHDWDLVDELGLMQQLDMELVHKEHAH